MGIAKFKRGFRVTLLRSYTYRCDGDTYRTIDNPEAIIQRGEWDHYDGQIYWICILNHRDEFIAAHNCYIERQLELICCNEYKGECILQSLRL